jgi:hypothetical protein
MQKDERDVRAILKFYLRKLASLQLLGVAAEQSSAVLRSSISRLRSIPLDDVAVCIAKWHFPVEHPAVFSICSTDASFVLEDFPSREAGSPLGQNPVFRVKESSPTCTRLRRQAWRPGSPTKAY